MPQDPSSSVPGFPDPDLALQLKELQSFGLRLPNNPMAGTNAARASQGALKHDACRVFSSTALAGTMQVNFYTGGPTGGGYVDSMTTEIPTDADAFALILANASTSQATTVAGVSYRVAGDMGQRPFNAVAAVAGSFGGSAGTTIAVAPNATYANYVKTDITPISTVVRTDTPSETRRILHARVAYTAIGGDTTGTTPVTYWSRGGGTRWTTNPTGFKCYTFLQAGNLATNIGNTGNADGGSTIFGIIYYSRGRVRTILLNGDSFVEGQQEGDAGRSFGVEGIIASAAVTGVPTEYMCSGKGGVGSIEFNNRAFLLANLFTPTDWVQTGYTPNDGAAVAGINTQRASLLSVAKYCDDKGVKLFSLDGSPSTNAGNTVSNYDAATQARQLAWNVELANYARLIPVSSLTQGGGGLWAPGASTDGVHPQESWTTGTLVPLVAKYLNQ